MYNQKIFKFELFAISLLFAIATHCNASDSQVTPADLIFTLLKAVFQTPLPLPVQDPKVKNELPPYNVDKDSYHNQQDYIDTEGFTIAFDPSDNNYNAEEYAPASQEGISVPSYGSGGSLVTERPILKQICPPRAPCRRFRIKDRVASLPAVPPY